MIQGLYSASSALRAYTFAQNVTAVNVSNINTNGYQSRSTTFSELESGGTRVNSVRTDRGVGYLINTGRALDVTVGSGTYLKVDTPAGAKLENGGAFHLDSNGDITDSEGNILLEDVAEPGDKVSIEKDGSVLVNGAVKDKLELYKADGSKVPDGVADVRSGYLEASNVDAAREIVDMMTYRNSFAANIKTITTNDQMLGLIVNMKG